MEHASFRCRLQWSRWSRIQNCLYFLLASINLIRRRKCVCLVIYKKKKNQLVVPKSKEKKKHFKNFRQVVLTLPWRQEKKHHTVQARRSEQYSSTVLAIPALGPEWCIQEREKKKNVVGSTPWRTIWMLSWRRLRGYFACYVFSEVSLMCVKRKLSRQTWQRASLARSPMCQIAGRAGIGWDLVTLSLWINELEKSGEDNFK